MNAVSLMMCDLFSFNNWYHMFHVLFSLFILLVKQNVAHCRFYISSQSSSDVQSESRPPPPLLKIPLTVHGHEDVPASIRELPMEQSPQDPVECHTPAHCSHPSPSPPPHMQSAPSSPQESSDGRKFIAQILDK